MALSINPLEIFELIQKKKLAGREQTADYLDAIAAEAANLANIWNQVAARLLRGSWDNYNEMVQYVDSQQIAPRFRLEHFYREITSTLENSMSRARRETVISIISKLLFQRDVTRSIYDDFMSKVNQSVFLDNRNNTTVFVDLAQSTIALNREAAALFVLAKSYRASGK
jgi:hypothetical protein